VALVPGETGAAPPPRSDEVPDVLVDCHLRLRHFTGLAVELAAQQRPAPGQVREVATQVHRYFTVALPLHEEDEERSLFPRLLARVPTLAQTIRALREAHEVHAVRVGALVALCHELQTWPERFPALREEVAKAAAVLAETWQVHFTTEESELFPPAKTMLTTEDRGAIREEMRARRARLPR
jgi:hemerythrin-like domain-containing protein